MLENMLSANDGSDEITSERQKEYYKCHHRRDKSIKEVVDAGICLNSTRRIVYIAGQFGIALEILEAALNVYCIRNPTN
jgi:hypothetical protein